MSFATPSPAVAAKSALLASDPDPWSHCPCGYATGNPDWWDNHRSRCDAQWALPPRTTEAEAS